MNTNQLIWINPSAPRDIFRQVAKIHVDQLNVGLLASFGSPFLERFYRRAATDPRAIFIAIIKDGEVIGFVLGCVSPFKFYIRILVWLWPSIIWHLLWRPGDFRRGLSLARYVGSKPSIPSPELLSIAVAPAFQRSGAGAKLLRQFQLRLHVYEISDFRVTASETQDNAIKFYRKYGGVIVSETDLGGLKSFTFLMPVV